MDLEEIRKRIDEVDEGILELFLKRMELSESVAAYKRAHGLPILNRERERAVLASVMEKAGENDHYAYELFHMLFAMSKARQSELMGLPSPVREKIEKAVAAPDEVFARKGAVACQGLEGSNSQAACDKLLPMGHIVYVKTFEAVFDAVRSGLCKYGVLPIENSSNGSVRAVYELLREREAFIVRSTSLHIRHALLAKPGVRLDQIREIHSHDQALGQCSRFLASLPEVRALPCSNTAAAAKMAAASPEPGIAAIASPGCAGIYGLNILKEDVADSENNYTRFLCIAREPVIYAGSNRISLILSCGNAPGDLNGILAKIAARGVNMCKLESCPVKGRNFEFMFFIELEASIHEPGVIAMLEELERACQDFSLLGSYAAV